ncbi:hemolysin family protein [Roseitranquillus sediminis]|uniref:hemolysin family protein n=1 Tax=Roseitranquillus sediminis TaxID=2809051 RepID=UPI001D0C0FEF|nr:hemolysin family protein [Roseitranquillus sediminis]MBM9593071.1 HlyC/CorC family transporter [Roseitranquillus sediminis]
MADIGDGSTEAARGAHQDDSSEHDQGDGRGGTGFLSRLVGAFTGAEGQANAQLDAPRPEPRPGLLNLRRMRVEDVAIPKAEIVAVSADTDKDALVAIFRESGMTRLPVYDGTLDTPVGMIHLKDFALQHGFNGTTPDFDVRKLLRPLLYVPPSMPIGILLTKMQAERMHMALVIDEYGGVDGLVTIEDLIEQVVGEIEDEHDIAEDGYWTQESEDCWLVQSRAPLDEFEGAIGRRLVDVEDEEEIDTVGGLVFMLAGRVPARGEVIHHPTGPDFEVVDADPRRIKRLRVRLAGVQSA